MMDYYMWIKAMHVIAVISWMAGMLYLPRLFVYHTEAGQDSPIAPTFQIMERRLLRYIINPAMIASFVFGIWMLVLQPELLTGQGWMHAKLTLVLLLGGVHGMLSKYRRQLEKGTCTKSARYFRVLNEVPTTIMVLVVILVIVRPF